jgi:heptaprenylglyceryl phosphate synthase
MKNQYLRRKEKLLIKNGGKIMSEKIFREILNSKDGDYIIRAQILAAMKPKGW